MARSGPDIASLGDIVSSECIAREKGWIEEMLKIPIQVTIDSRVSAAQNKVFQLVSNFTDFTLF